MGISDVFSRAFPTKKSGTPVYKLTQLGRTKKEQFNIPNMKAIVMEKIEEKEPCSIKEISEETHIPQHKVEMIVKSLGRDGWVTRAGVEND